MDEQPTQTPAERHRAEQERRGIHPTPEVREWARNALEDARKTWTPDRFAALRAYSKRAAREHFNRPHQSPAA